MKYSQEQKDKLEEFDKEIESVEKEMRAAFQNKDKDAYMDADNRKKALEELRDEARDEMIRAWHLAGRPE